MLVNEMQPVELDFWAARALDIGVRVAASETGVVPVCWLVQKSRQMWTPSTRWRQCSRVLSHMCKHGQVTLDATGKISVARIRIRRGAEFQTIQAIDNESMTIALVRCFLLWRYGEEINDVQVN